MCHTNIAVRPATLWDSSGRIPVCTNCNNMAPMHQWNWCIQYCALEPSCLSSSLSLLYVQVLKENPERGLDVFRWNPAVHDR